MRSAMGLTALCLAATVVGGAWAKQLFVYPAQGQSQEQMERDKFACHQFARDSSGFDPMQQPSTTSPAPAQPEGSVAGGAGKGALIGGLGGAAVGAVAGDTGKGAAIGAIGGGLFGGMRSSNQQSQARQSRQQWEQQQAAQSAANWDNYNRAYSACLEGRGYTVR